LTADEVRNLNLAGIKLAVLSACETGLGQINGSEGVFGLQRSLKMAGVRYVMMSLWKVPDLETADFMQTFYKTWATGQVSARTAFLQTQRAMQAKYAKPYQWAAFVLVE
jgi:CHAT domain-containing protein